MYIHVHAHAHRSSQLLEFDRRVREQLMELLLLHNNECHSGPPTRGNFGSY